MSKKNGVPDAWDDDWVNVADKLDTNTAQPQSAPKLTKQQRRIQHAEQQKQLWNSSDSPDRFHWLETQGVVPLKQEYKQPVTLLSRKPAPPNTAKDRSTNGIENLALDDGEDSEDEARKIREADLEERQRKAKIEREEKQRKYAEARERIMGSSPARTSGSRESSTGRKPRAPTNGKRASQPTSSADQSPARMDRQLFDPDDMGRRLIRREDKSLSREGQPSRQPRGPEQSGRGGFGFGGRGAGTAS